MRATDRAHCIVKKFLLLLAGAGSLAASETNQIAKPVLPRPTAANVKYGPHERNVLDFWQAKSDKPAPVLFYIHGGGWRGGDKSMAPVGLVKAMLDHQISVVSINYRYSDQAKLPAPVHDAAHALQFVRFKAAEWNINKDRIAAIGASAGACTTMWLAYHNDLADAKSQDPLGHESTRLSAGVGVVGQTSIDPEVIVPWVGEQIMNHGMIWRAVGATNKAEVKLRYPEYKELYHEFSPINHVTKDDPAVFLYYATPASLPATNAGIAIHHAMLGEKLKEKAQAVGAPCELQTVDKVEQDAPVIIEFLVRNLSK